MEYTYKQMKHLFLRQSCVDSWDDYERSINKSSFIKWDYIILTASNEEQAQTYRHQIDYRLKNNLLPKSAHYAVLSDPNGKRVGSGGATFNVLRYLAECEENPFEGKRILVIHSGGDSKRVPQYSAIGKLFSPVPRVLPDGRGSTLFDEFIIGMSGVPSRFREGMLVLSGDVMLLFNPLQIDAMFNGAAAISIKEPVSIGKDHGVFLGDKNGFVKSFLHKQSEDKLRSCGATNEHDCVDLDTGAVLFDSSLLKALFSLISSNGKNDDNKFNEFVNEDARISFYGDFLYPLATDSTLEQYYNEAAEGVINDELTSCRTKIWNVLHDFSMKLICLSPAEFIHFGTTFELRELVTNNVSEYAFLDWKRQVVSTGCKNDAFAAHNAYIGRNALINPNAYIESSYILGNCVIGQGAIVSNCHIRDCEVLDNSVWHSLCLKDGSFVIRTYGVCDNPKGRLSTNTAYLNTTLSDFMSQNDLEYSDVWDNNEDYLWFAKLYPVCKTQEEAANFAQILQKMATGTASCDEIALWKKQSRTSLYLSFNSADTVKTAQFEHELESRILANEFISLLDSGVYYNDALKVFGNKGITEEIFNNLINDAENMELYLKIRIYYAVSRYMKQNKVSICNYSYDAIEAKCFDNILKTIYDDAASRLFDISGLKISKESVDVSLPVRVNFGGGWTDTPPHCNERGGTVLNAAINLNGILPVRVSVKRLDEYKVQFESCDIGVKGDVFTVNDIRDCHNPYDSFALHKAALIACGVIPMNGSESLEAILKRLGGGIYLSTQVIGVPKGSGLGTSSILSAACVKGIFEFLDKELSNDEIYDIVLCMEQIMSTGGGWQDQVGGVTNGFKFIRTKSGIRQQIKVDYIEIPRDAKQELQERFALIYTGQRRLARNLLRDVVGNYIGARPQSVDALKKMPPLSALMRFSLESGDIDEFANLLNKHWELSKQLDSGSTNTCIDQIFLACDDLIAGKMICGAGGGGFLQVILKKGVTKTMLNQRLMRIFQNSGVGVWDSEFIF